MGSDVGGIGCEFGAAMSPPYGLPPISSPSIGSGIGMLPMTVDSLATEMLHQGDVREYVQVKSYAPEIGPCNERTRVLVVVEAFSGSGTCTVVFDGTTITAREISPGCFEFYTPLRSTGCIGLFWMTRPASAGAEDPPVSTTAMPFCMMPCDDRGHLSLSSNEFLLNPISGQVIHNFRHSIRELDLSHNSLSFVYIYILFPHLIKKRERERDHLFIFTYPPSFN